MLSEVFVNNTNTINITISENGLGFYVNQYHPLLFTIQNTFALCTNPFDLELITGNVDTEDYDLSFIIKPLMMPFKTENRVTSGTYIYLVSKTEVTYIGNRTEDALCGFTYYGSSLVLMSNQSTLIDDNSIHTFTSGIYGGSIYCLNCFNISVSNPLFQYGFAFYGGAMFLMYDRDNGGKISIDFSNYNISNSIGLMTGSVAQIDGADNDFSIRLRDSNLESLGLGQDINDRDSTISSGGGFLHIVARNIDISIDNCRFIDLNGTVFGAGLILYA